MELDIRNWGVEIRVDLYHAGVDEFGTPYHAECYYVVITSREGKRLAHNKVFKGCDVNKNEDGFCFFTDIRKSALAEVTKLMERVCKVLKIDTQYWCEIEPVYGSEYYCKRVYF